MNVVCGGTLYQDLPTQFDSDVQHRDPELVDFTYHDVTIEDGQPGSPRSWARAS